MQEHVCVLFKPPGWSVVVSYGEEGGFGEAEGFGDHLNGNANT